MHARNGVSSRWSPGAVNQPWGELFIGGEDEDGDPKVFQSSNVREAAALAKTRREPELAIGLNSHSDISGPTVPLQINETEGLQIRKDGVWVPIKPLPNAFVINIGDIMEYPLSNGFYRSVEHRATVNSVKERISVATFCSPKLEGEMGPAPSLISPQTPPLFKRLGITDYFKVNQPWGEPFTGGEDEDVDPTVFQSSNGREEEALGKTRRRRGIRAGMDPNDMEVLFEEGQQGMRINYYPPCPEPELEIGLNPILIPVASQFYSRSTRRKIVSNGIYGSVEHRATANSVKERISVATFYSPKLEGEMGPAPSLISPQTPPLFKRIGVADYLIGFFIPGAPWKILFGYLTATFEPVVVKSHLHLSLSTAISVPISDEIRPHFRRNPSISISQINPRNHSRSEMKNQPPMTLTPLQRKLFEDTCFGPWLKVQHTGVDAMLTHLFLQTTTNDLPEGEFCLITGLRFGNDDVDDEHPPLREPSPHQADSIARHPEPSPGRASSPPPPSPIPSHHRASSPPSLHDRRPTKRLCLSPSPCSPPPRDKLEELRDEVGALRHEVDTLREDNSAWHDEIHSLRGEVDFLRDDNALPGEVYTLRDEVAALREIVSSLQNKVHTLRNERPDKVDALRRVYLARRGSRIRRHARAIMSPFTPLVPRLRKNKPDAPIIIQEAPCIVQEAPLIIEEAPPTVQEAPIIVQVVPPAVQEPDSFGVIYRHIDKPPPVPDIIDVCWLSYELSASTIPQQEMETLPDKITDNTLWAKTAVDFYLHERSKGCYSDLCQIDNAIHLFLDRSWWGTLLGVEDNGYLEGGVYDSMLNYIPLSDLRDIITKRWSDHLAKYLNAIDYWTKSGNKKPKKFKITMIRDETAPQQTQGARGDCGPLVCLCLERLTTGSIKYLPPTDRDRAVVGLWFRHYMVRSIYTRCCLPASAC
ncbi:Codeine O-demethylase [Hibiscus syriacus]|uniref:Codeine O-demethylase n=1 Tax=Hibiscus syriacus TaxID=106335 RepID=A0A6A3ANX9_HIBSY|nr:Codeine O-demethylase [Hibiscus syriacus]